LYSIWKQMFPDLTLLLTGSFFGRNRMQQGIASEVLLDWSEAAWLYFFNISYLKA